MLADSSGKSSTVPSYATQTWIDLLYHELKFLIKWPSKKQMIMNLPDAFTQFPGTRAFIDCTEHFIQKPQSPAAQSQSWSDYKQSNTFKQLVGFLEMGLLFSYHHSTQDVFQTEK